MTKAPRIVWIDTLRAITIILVVIGHTGLENSARLNGYIYDWIYLFHMPLFMMLSGISFSLLKAKKNYAILIQLLNMILIYIIQSVFYILLNVIMQSRISTRNVLSLANLLSFTYKPVAHFWYLYALIIIYLIEIIIEHFTSNKNIQLMIVIVLSVFGSFSSFGILSKALYHLFYFECGKQLERIKKTPIFVCFIGLLFSFLLPMNYIEISKYIKIIVTYFVAFSLSVLFIYVSEKFFTNSNKTLLYIGKNCIWIYIFHSYFTSTTRHICGRVFGEMPILSSIIVSIIGVFGPVAICYLLKTLRLNRIVDKPISFFQLKCATKTVQ